ncbi:MAG: hypothetical protein AAFY42_00445 [Pseudomonadota bacterium]
MEQETQRLIARWPLVLPLAVPTLAGVIYLWMAGAPGSFVLINSAALAVGSGLIATLRLPGSSRTRLVIAGALLCLLAMPMLLGPSVDGIERWVSLGGFTLHTGFLAAPLLVRIAASEQRTGTWILLVAIVLAFSQPDFATCLALSLGALAAAICKRQGAMFAVGVLGLAASLGASFAVSLPPQPFVERVLPKLWAASPLAAGALGLALLSGAAALCLSQQMPKTQRWAVLGTMLGFLTAAALSDYPYPLIGYGAASILGFAISLLTPASKGD